MLGLGENNQKVLGATGSQFVNIEESCEISYVTKGSWENQINGEIIVKNIGSTVIENWGIEFSYSGQIETVWNANYFKKGELYRITGADWNKTIAPNATVEVGFIATIDDDTENPSAFSFLNGYEIQKTNNAIEEKANTESEILFGLTKDKKYNVYTPEKSLIGEKIQLSTQKSDCCSMVECMPNLNDGIVALYKDNTKVYDSVTSSKQTFENSESFLSNSDIIINSRDCFLANVVTAHNDICINSEQITSSEMTTLYSKTGNVELNSNKIRIDGMIYVPNGKIIINADTFELSGMIIAKDISIMVSDSYIRNTDKILKRYNVLKNINLDLIQDVNDVYGSYYANEFDYEELAKSIIVSNVDSIKAKDFGKIELGDRIELYDEMDKLKSYGYNYTFGEQYGAVIMSAHSFGFLADKIIPDTVLCDCVDKIYYFANGEVYYRKSDEIYDNHNQLLSTEKFNGMKSYLIGCRLNITYEQLKSINEENELLKLPTPKRCVEP